MPYFEDLEGCERVAQPLKLHKTVPDASLVKNQNIFFTAVEQKIHVLVVVLQPSHVYFMYCSNKFRLKKYFRNVHPVVGLTLYFISADNTCDAAIMQDVIS